MGRSFFLGQKFAKSLKGSELYLSKKKLDVESATSYAIVDVDVVPAKSRAVMADGDFPAFQKAPVCFTFWETEAGKTFVKVVTPYTTVGDSAKAVTPYISLDSFEDAVSLASVHENRRAGPPPALDKFVATHFAGEWETIGPQAGSQTKGGQGGKRTGRKQRGGLRAALRSAVEEINAHTTKTVGDAKMCNCCNGKKESEVEPEASPVVEETSAGGGVGTPADPVTKLDVPLLSRGPTGMFSFPSAMDREQLTLSTLTARSVL